MTDCWGNERVSTPRKHWFKVADSVAYEPWSNDAAATFLRLGAHLNTRWAREGRTPDEAVEVVIAKGTALLLTGSGSLARARSILRELATHVTLIVDEQGTNTLLRWPKFAEFQKFRSRSGVAPETVLPPDVPPPQDARRKTQDAREEDALRADAHAAPSEDSAIESPADPAPDPASSAPADEGEQSRTRRTRKRPEPPPEAIRFAEDFRASIAAIGIEPPTPVAFNGWCDSARQLLARRPEAEARALARWLFTGTGGNADFWRGVVMCPRKFRQKYDQLKKAKERDEKPTARSDGGPAKLGAFQAIAELRRRREAAREREQAG